MIKALTKAVLTLVFSLASLSANAEYTFTALDGLEGKFFGAASINNSGQIVGYTQLAPFSTHATIWNNGVATDLHPQDSQVSNATSINDLGQIVGYSTNPNGNGRATLWNNGVVTDLNPPGSFYGYAGAINNSGQIVGMSDYLVPGVGARATLWNNGVATNLNPPDGVIGDARAINNSGQILVYSETDGRTASNILWTNGVATDLDSQYSQYFINGFTSINDLGQILGSRPTNGGYTAFLLNNGEATALGTLGGNISGASSINNLGQIVGYSTTADGSNRAVLWNDGVATDLNSFLSASDISAGWVLTQALDINENGWIIGDATNTVSNVQRDFLLQSVTPVPEPETYAMLLMGLGVIGFVVRRRKNTQA